jgi:hypothetical protein
MGEYRDRWIECTDECTDDEVRIGGIIRREGHLDAPPDGPPQPGPFI